MLQSRLIYIYVGQYFVELVIYSLKHLGLGSPVGGHNQWLTAISLCALIGTAHWTPKPQISTSLSEYVAYLAESLHTTIYIYIYLLTKFCCKHVVRKLDWFPLKCPLAIVQYMKFSCFPVLQGVFGAGCGGTDSQPPPHDHYRGDTPGYQHFIVRSAASPGQCPPSVARPFYCTDASPWMARCDC